MSARVLVVGGGVGGLTAATALRAAGCDVVVLERAPELGEVGAGLLLQVNALAALATLGVAEDVSRTGVPVDGGSIATTDGRVLTALEWDGGVGVGIHRAELQAILLRHAGPDVVRTGAEVTAYRPEGDRIVAVLASGEEVTGDLLLGADGIRSTVRAQHLGDGAPRYSGYTCWRGVTHGADRFERGKVFEIWGAGRRFGGVHIDERLYWFAPVNASEGGRDEPGRSVEAALDAFAGWPERVRETISSTPESAILRNDILDRPFRSGWGEGRMTLLGDAAHPMTPNLGQGACQAIEDAVVLGRCLRVASDPVDALRRYERRRVARTRSLVVRSRRIGQVAQWESVWARRLRDSVLRAAPAALVRRDLRRMLRFE